MRSVSDKNKLQGQSLPEVWQAWKQVSLDLALDPEVRDAARGALREGNLLNAFTIWCCLQSPSRRKEIAEFGLRVLEYLKDQDQSVSLVGHTVEDFGQRMGLVDNEDGAAKKPRSEGGRDVRPKVKQRGTG